MVGVAEGDVLAADPALSQYRLGLIVEAVALPGLRGEYRDVLEDTHRRDAVDHQVAALTAGTEHDELVPAAGGGIGLGRGQDVLLGQATAGHDLIQILDRPGATRGGEANAGPQQRQQRSFEWYSHGLPLSGFWSVAGAGARGTRCWIVMFELLKGKDGISLTLINIAVLLRIWDVHDGTDCRCPDQALPSGPSSTDRAVTLERLPCSKMSHCLF